MSLLDQKLLSGQTRELNSEWYNQLVDRLSNEEMPGKLRVEQSAPVAYVHHQSADASEANPLVPGQVWLKDATDWNGLDHDRIRVRWQLSGVGHLSMGSGQSQQITASPGEAVYWSWAENEDTGANRTWDFASAGLTLPTHATVNVQARLLSTTTHGPSVATASDLSSLTGVGQDERRLVRDEDRIYRYDGDEWVNDSAPSYTTIDQVTRHIVVDRTFNPAERHGVHLKLQSSTSFIDLAGGPASATVVDQTHIPDGLTVTNRTVSAQYLRATAEPPVVEVDSSDESLITLQPTVPGTVVLSVSYEIDDKTYSISEVFQVRGASVQSVLPSAEEPKLPSYSIIPGDGQFSIAIGQEVNILALSVTGTQENATFEWTDAAPEDVAGRVRIPQITATVSSDEVVEIPQQTAEEIAAIGDFLRATFSHRGAHPFTSFLVTAEAEDTLVAGDFITGSGFALLVEERLERTQDSTFVYRMRGWASQAMSFPTTGRTRPLGDTLSVEATFGFGTLGAETFPRKTHRETRTLSVQSAAESVDFVLPQASATRRSDAWYVSLRMASRWSDGREDVVEESWTRCETRPTAAPQLSLGSASDQTAQQLFLHGGAHTFYGLTAWAGPGSDPKEVLPEEKVISNASPIATSYPAEAPSRFAEGARFVVAGQYRASAGTPQSDVFYLTSTKFFPKGLDLHVIDSDAPDREAPDTNGVLLSGHGATWMSVGGAWLKITSESTGFLPIDTVRARAHTTDTDYALLPVSKISSNSRDVTITPDDTTWYEVEYRFTRDVGEAALIQSGANATATVTEENTVLLKTDAITAPGENEEPFARRFVLRVTDQAGESHDFILRLVPSDKQQSVYVESVDVDTDDTYSLTRVSSALWRLGIAPLGGDGSIEINFAGHSEIESAVLSGETTAQAAGSYGKTRGVFTISVTEFQENTAAQVDYTLKDGQERSVTVEINSL